jgi:hypothetical protein
MISKNILGRHNKFVNKTNQIVNHQVAKFFSTASKRRDMLMANSDRNDFLNFHVQQINSK